MSRLFSYIALAGIAAFALMSDGRHVANATQERCHEDWAVASSIVASRNMVNVAELSKIAREKYDGQVMTARLCNDKEDHFYRVVIRQDDGRVLRVKINAD